MKRKKALIKIVRSKQEHERERENSNSGDLPSDRIKCNFKRENAELNKRIMKLEYSGNMH